MSRLDLSPEAARRVLAEIQAISRLEADKYLPVNCNTFARLVLFRLIRQLDEQLPERERGQVVVLPHHYDWKYDGAESEDDPEP